MQVRHVTSSSWPVRLLVAGLLFLVLLCATMSAQETTAGVQGTVKDPTGAVIIKANVEVTGPALIGVKKMDTDSGGYFRFANLPPGSYTITVTATGFRTAKLENIDLAVGRLPSLEVSLQVGTATETVEVSAQAAIVDTTTSKVQTTISDNLLANLPTQSRSFQSVIQFAPGARTEPLQGNGYQIDGASNSENSYLVEGQETASVFDGHSAANVPMDFIQEVQVKSSGFEAEYGGALGGVVNVIQKRGGNDWHGSLFTYYGGSAFNAAPNPTVIRNPQIAANANGAKRLDQPIEVYTPVKDHYRTTTPGFQLGGSFIKDRLWISAGAAPQFYTANRTVNFGPTTNSPGKRTFYQTQNTYYSMARLDFLATQKIRLYGSWTYQAFRGVGTSWPGQEDVNGLYNSSSTTNPDNWNGGIGSVQPNVIYNMGADITLTPSLILTSRYGYFYQDNQSRGLPSGIRYIYTNTNYNYSPGIAGLPTTTALNGQTLPSEYQHALSWSNIGANAATVFDKWQRFSFSQDMAYFKRFAGTHNFKFGYSFNRGTNDILNGYNTADVYVAFNQEYYPNSTNGQDRCKQIVAQNTSLYAAAGGVADGSACQGLWGTVNLRDLATVGKVGGWNHAFYGQDSWTIGRRLTLNIGIRLDKESLPSYHEGFQGVNFGWGDKIAPRLGGSYDVLGNGKLKAYASFGYFYDIMKYQMSRGSFGGDYWHDCVYALDSPNFSLILPTRDANNHYCPAGGGSLPGVGSLPNMRFIENWDFRVYSNDPNQAGSLGKSGLIDPNLMPMKQHEMVIGAEWAINSSLAFETRYSRKRLDRTIEDTGVITQDGEVWYIANPGFGVNSVTPNCPNCPPNPKATRDYDGIEFRLTKRLTSKFTGSFSYTYSRLYGNYTGLTATDISDGGAGRDGANTDRAFDEPFMQFDAHGQLQDGPLPTDRPNTIKAYGYYNLKYWKFNTMIGVYQQIYSGTPVTSYLTAWNAPVFVEGRGKFVSVTRNPSTGDFVAGGVSDMRTPRFLQSDLSVSQDFHVSKSNERLVARVGAECFNCLNQRSPLYVDANLMRTGSISPYKCGTAGVSCTPFQTANAGFDYGAMMSKGFDYIAQSNTNAVTLNSRYGQPYSWQGGRSMR
ncbi:MAG: TonB-dependent receptor, partial [Acidobacteriia bacterium]|nr:TonB-dependent receptor [Terriglobia bacterium]